MKPIKYLRLWGPLAAFLLLATYACVPPDSFPQGVPLHFMASGDQEVVTKAPFAGQHPFLMYVFRRTEVNTPSFETPLALLRGHTIAYDPQAPGASPLVVDSVDGSPIETGYRLTQDGTYDFVLVVDLSRNLPAQVDPLIAWEITAAGPQLTGFAPGSDYLAGLGSAQIRIEEAPLEPVEVAFSADGLRTQGLLLPHLYAALRVKVQGTPQFIADFSQTGSPLQVGLRQVEIEGLVPAGHLPLATWPGRRPALSPQGDYTHVYTAGNAAQPLIMPASLAQGPLVAQDLYVLPQTPLTGTKNSFQVRFTVEIDGTVHQLGGMVQLPAFVAGYRYTLTVNLQRATVLGGLEATLWLAGENESWETGIGAE